MGFRKLRNGSTIIAAMALGTSLPGVAMAGTSPLLALTPWPASVVQRHGTLAIKAGDGISIPSDDTGAAVAAALLVEHARIAGIPALTIANAAGARTPIRIVRDSAVSGEEAYRLIVNKREAVISASGDRGLLHGAMSLLQLIDAGRVGSGKVAVPAVTINDAPRFVWRGVMIDTARHFQPIESIYAVVDSMVEVKLNTLHLHLTDDQGWRFEVKRYPELTRIGGWRLPPDTGGGPGPKTGGFYTQEELKKLVVYAAVRGVTIVPEIDLPGHAQALVASYPQFGVLGDRPAVSHDWGVNPWLFNPAPEGIAFVRELLDQVMEVFPSTFIHLGGDEAVKDQWERSPQVQSQMRQLGLKTENEMQSWMIDQFGTYLAQHGRRLIGWDEILEGGLPPSASVMSWRGEKGAVDAVNADHDVVLSPAPNLYLDSLQSALPDEPPGRISIQTLEDVYRYDPMPKGIDPQKQAHVLGVQANAWSEYLTTPYQVQHVLFPRAGALAEVAWSQPTAGKQDYAAFLSRLAPQMRRWKRGGVEVADSAFAVAFTPAQPRGEALQAKRLGISLATQAPYGIIRYTLDGNAPSVKSPVYRSVLTLRPGTIVTAASFGPDGAALSAPRRYDTGRQALLTSTASALTACPRGSQGLRVPLTSDANANGPAFNVNIFDTCQADDHAPLAHTKAITVSVARLPRNYGLAHEASALVEHFAVTTHGELVVTAGCRAAERAATLKQKEHAPMPGATVLATFPLPDPSQAPQQFTFTANLSARPDLKDESDVCFQFTSPLSDPFYAIEKVVYSETTG